MKRVGEVVIKARLTQQVSEWNREIGANNKIPNRRVECQGNDILQKNSMPTVDYIQGRLAHYSRFEELRSNIAFLQNISSLLSAIFGRAGTSRGY